jgi:uncharacterized phage protein (TIGR01671 family)
MRKISFRAYSKGQKKIFQVSNINFVTGEIQWFGFGQETPPLNDFILMQYTGQKDKNEKMIYDGDIVEWNEGENKKPVYWDNKECSFYVGDEDEGYLLHELDCEIIGNIYENPDILKSA